MPSFKHTFIALCLLAAPALAAPAHDTPQANSPFLSTAALAPHQATIHRVEQYLSSLTTIISDFTQTAPDGALTSGKFYLERPGKMRWQYNPPTPILMVANGSELVYYDFELEQVSHIPLDSTLIGFLAQDSIRFEGGIGIEDFQETPGAIRLTVAQTSKPDEGRLTLEFSDHPLILRSMVVRDAQNQITSVSLNNARFGVPLDAKLFVFQDPRKGRMR